MKPTIKHLVVFTGIMFLTFQSPLFADARRSENVRILADTISSGSSASSSTDGSVEIVATVGSLGTGISSGGSVVINGSYAGQLFEVESVEVVPSAPEIDEVTGMVEFAGVVTYDDGSIALVDGADMVWTGNVSPLGPVSIDGTFPNQVAVTTGGSVYTDTAGSVTGLYINPAAPGTGHVLVRDTIPDNFGGYGGDGLEDGFQVQFFGQPPNADAAPDVDFDGDGQDNETEELTGFDPTDVDEFFRWKILDKSGTTARFEINKVMDGRSYTLRRGTDILGFPAEVLTLEAAVEETNRAIEDSGATESTGFYVLDVERTGGGE